MTLDLPEAAIAECRNVTVTIPCVCHSAENEKLFFGFQSHSWNKHEKKHRLKTVTEKTPR